MSLKTLKRIGNFIGFQDTPSTFVGKIGQELMVNNAENGTDFTKESLSTDATRPATADLDWDGNKLTAVADPTIDSDMANKQYIDGLVAAETTMGIIEYVFGNAYVVDDIIVEKGTIYKVITAIDGLETRTPYSKIVPLNLGTGAAYSQVLAGSTNNWVRLCTIRSYTSGIIYAPMSQSSRNPQLHIRFSTNYQTANFEVMYDNYSTQPFDLISFRQSAVGQPWEVWIRSPEDSAPDINLHFVCHAAGGHVTSKAISIDDHIQYVASPTTAVGNFYEVDVSTPTKPMNWSSV